MKKTYCDMCQIEIVPSNNGINLDDKVRIATLDKRTQQPYLSVNISSSGDICKYCVIDEFVKQDDRPKI